MRAPASGTKVGYVSLGCAAGLGTPQDYLIITPRFG
jgi:hypothetical protein